MLYILAKNEEQINLARYRMQKFLLALVLAAVMFMTPVWVSILLPDEVADHIEEISQLVAGDDVEDDTHSEMSCLRN